MSSSDQGNVLCISLKEANNQLHEFADSTYYGTIRVGMDADQQSIRSACRKILLSSHSDKTNNPLLDIVESDFYEIRRILSNERSRREYDRSLMVSRINLTRKIANATRRIDEWVDVAVDSSRENFIERYGKAFEIQRQQRLKRLVRIAHDEHHRLASEREKILFPSRSESQPPSAVLLETGSVELHAGRRSVIISKGGSWYQCTLEDNSTVSRKTVPLAELGCVVSDQNSKSVSKTTNNIWDTSPCVKGNSLPLSERKSKTDDVKVKKKKGSGRSARRFDGATGGPRCTLGDSSESSLNNDMRSNAPPSRSRSKKTSDAIEQSCHKYDRSKLQREQRRQRKLELEAQREKEEEQRLDVENMQRIFECNRRANTKRIEDAKFEELLKEHKQIMADESPVAEPVAEPVVVSSTHDVNISTYDEEDIFSTSDEPYQKRIPCLSRIRERQTVLECIQFIWFAIISFIVSFCGLSVVEGGGLPVIDGAEAVDVDGNLPLPPPVGTTVITDSQGRCPFVYMVQALTPGSCTSGRSSRKAHNRQCPGLKSQRRSMSRCTTGSGIRAVATTTTTTPSVSRAFKRGKHSVTSPKKLSKEQRLLMRQRRQILEDAYALKELAKIHFHPETLRYRIRLSKEQRLLMRQKRQLESSSDVFFVQIGPGIIIEVEFNPKTLVGNVKKLVASVLDIPSNSIVFKPFNTSCITKDTATLEQYNVHPNNTLHLNEMGLLGGEDDSSVDSSDEDSEEPPNLISEWSCAGQSLLDLIPKLKRMNRQGNADPLIKLLLEEIKYLDEDVPLNDASQIRKKYIKFTESYMKLNKKLGNRGRDLSEKDIKRVLFVMCFATNKCIKYKADGIANRMDPNNECINWLIHMKFLGVLGDGGTEFSPGDNAKEEASEFFNRNCGLVDIMMLACKGTKACPKGNKMQVMKDQLKERSKSMGIKEDDQFTFWCLYGLVNIMWRVAYHYAQTKTPLSVYIASGQTLSYLFDNLNGEVQDNKYVVFTNGPHSQAEMSTIANNIQYPIEKIERYTKHMIRALQPLKGLKLSNGATVCVPSFREASQGAFPKGSSFLGYFYRRAKLPGFGTTPEEYARRKEILKEMCKKGGKAIQDMWNTIAKFWPTLTQTFEMSDEDAANFIGDVLGEGTASHILSKINLSDQHARKRELKGDGKSNEEAIETIREEFGAKAADGLKRHGDSSDKKSRAYEMYSKGKKADKSLEVIVAEIRAVEDLGDTYADMIDSRFGNIEHKISHAQAGILKMVDAAKKALKNDKTILIGIHSKDDCQGSECLIPWDGETRYKRNIGSNKAGDIKMNNSVACSQCNNRDNTFDLKRSTSSDEEWESTLNDKSGNFVHLKTAEAIDSWFEKKKLAVRDHILSKASSETGSSTAASEFDSKPAAKRVANDTDSKPAAKSSAAAASKPPTKKKKKISLNLDSSRVSSSSADSDGLADLRKEMAASAPEKKKKKGRSMASIIKESSASVAESDKSTKRQKNQSRKAMGDLTNTDKPPVERRGKKKKAPPPSDSSSDSDSSSFSLPKRVTTRRRKKRAKPAPSSPDSDTSDEEVLDDRFCSEMKSLPYSPDSLGYDRGEYVSVSDIDKVSISANETLLSRLEFGDGVFVRRSSRQWAYGIFVESEVFITLEYKVQFACDLRTKGQFVEKGASYFEGEKIRLIRGSRHLSSG